MANGPTSGLIWESVNVESQMRLETNMATFKTFGCFWAQVVLQVG